MTIKHKKCISENVNEELKWDCHCSGCYSCVQGKLIRNLKYYPKKSKTKQKQKSNTSRLLTRHKYQEDSPVGTLLVLISFDTIKSIYISIIITHRSNRREVFCKKSVLRNFAKFTRKHLYKSLFFNKVAGLSNNQLSSFNSIIVLMPEKRDSSNRHWKWMVASFSNFYGKTWVGFCLNIRKHFFLEFSF